MKDTVITPPPLTNKTVGHTISTYLAFMKKKKELHGLHQDFARAFVFSRSDFINKQGNRRTEDFAKQPVSQAVKQSYEKLFAAIQVQEAMATRLPAKLT